MIILQKYSSSRHCARIVPLLEAAEDGVTNARCRIYFVDGGLKMRRCCGGRRHLQGVFVVDPPGVHRSHEDGVFFGQGPRAGPRHHVQSGFRHVGVGVVRRLVTVKLAYKEPPPTQIMTKKTKLDLMV